MEEEIWKPVKGFEGIYEVSSLGRVRSLPRDKFQQGCIHHYKGRVLKPFRDTVGYLYVDLSQKAFPVHRLVANAYIPNPNKYSEINHKDENKKNNRVDNLEWCDRKYNVNYGSRLAKLSMVVEMLNEKGEVLKTFPSAMEAARVLGVRQGNVSNSCKHPTWKCGGYYWRYKEA